MSVTAIKGIPMRVLKLILFFFRCCVKLLSFVTQTCGLNKVPMHACFSSPTAA